METIRDLAIVLKWIPYEERHRVVTALTENYGRISALARNSIQSRRFGGALEPFAASEWQFVERKGAELYRVQEAEIKRSYSGLSASLEKLSLASCFGELMMRLAPEREPAPELFKLHSNALAAVEEISETSPVQILSLLNAYLAKILQWSGSQPQTQRCQECARSLEEIEDREELAVLIADAGWLCPSCRSSGTRHVEGQGFHGVTTSVTARALKKFNASLSVPIRKVSSLVKITESEAHALFRVISLWMEYHVPGYQEQSLKSLRFLGLKSTR